MMEPYAAAKSGAGCEGAGPDIGLEESMWRLGLGGGEAAARLPERPGEADCVYYLRTGACGYGENCRYSHPRDRAAAFNGGGRTTRTAEYPERPGQPLCEYYMKNGTCKFGSNCKYDHPREGGSVQPVVLNTSGCPLRPVKQKVVKAERVDGEAGQREGTCSRDKTLAHAGGQEKTNEPNSNSISKSMHFQPENPKWIWIGAIPIQIFL